MVYFFKYRDSRQIHLFVVRPLVPERMQPYGISNLVTLHILKDALLFVFS